MKPRRAAPALLPLLCLSTACAPRGAVPTPSPVDSSAAGAGAEESTGRPFDFLFAPPAPGEGFRHVSSYDTTGGNADRREVAPGDSVVLLDTDGPGVVRRLWITVASRDPHYLRRIALKMYWEGETGPSVEAPLGDFFGNGFDRRHYAALPMGVSSGGFFSYLPMPFARHARIVAYNGTGRPIDAFYFNLDLTTGDRLPRPLETFHAWWHQDRRTTSRRPHLILDAVGLGRFVGMSLNAESYNNELWFLEGDEIWHVDGRFRGQGTGTEDYFNSGWYFDRGPFAAPFHGLVVKDDSIGRIAAYRWQLLDAVPFHDSIRVEIEHGHANQEVADYATMAYWYQTEPHRPLPPLPPPNEREVLGVKIPPSALPADSLTASVAPGGIRVRVPAPRPDRYEVIVYPRAARPGDTLRAGLSGATPRVLALSGDEVGRVLPPASLGEVAVTGDDATLVLSGGAARRLAASPAAAVDTLLAAVELRPLRVWAREWNVVGPFANPQRLGTEYSPALDSVYGPERGPASDRGYAGLGGARVEWKRVTAGEDGYVNLNRQFQPNDHVAAYAEAFLVSPGPRRVTLLLGADDAHVLWVNGREVSRRQGRNISEADDVAVPVTLHAGCNRVLLKVADLDGGWAFQIRAADPFGTLRWRAGTCR